jgi:hypothetical protein
MLRGVRALLMSAVLALFSAACGSGGPQLPPELLDAIAAGDSGARSLGYPPPPYGNTAGETLEDACFSQAWLDPLASQFDVSRLGRLCFSDFYDPDGAKGTKVLLINTSALWCLSCYAEWEAAGDAGSVIQRRDELRPQGFLVFGLLFQDSEGRPANREHLRAWARRFSIDVPLALDPDFQMGRYARQNVQPFNMLVDTATMKILDSFEGDQSQAIASKVLSYLEEAASPSKGS